MSYSDESYNLRIELDTKHCTCSAREIAKMEEALEPLTSVARDFPVSDLYVTVIHHTRSGDYHVKTALVLSGRTLFTGERHREMYPAYQQCMDKLVKKVKAYKHQLSLDAEKQRAVNGTDFNVVPTNLPEHDEIEAAVQENDYPRFRSATMMYEEPVRKRVGRWIQRYPELESVLGQQLEIADIVEDVFLTAFDQFEHKSTNLMPGQWLEKLIDPVIHDIIDHPDRELENISMARSARDVAAAERES